MLDLLEKMLEAGQKYHRAGNFPQAEQVYRQALRLMPDLPEVHNSLGIVLAQGGKPAEAEACFREAVRLQPEFVQAHSNLGNVLADRGRREEALACYANAVQLQPDFAQAHSNLGNLLVELGRPDEAVVHCRQAARFQPDSAEAHNNLGNALRAQGRLDAAVASYQEALRLRPDHVEARSNLGVALAEQGNLDEAVASFQQAIYLRPDNAGAHQNLGNALQKLSRFAEAAERFREVVRLRPDDAAANNSLGLALAESGRFDEALDSYRRALQLKPEYAEAHDNLGNALQALGNLDEAVASHQRALRANPDFAEAHTNLGAALAGLGRLDAALSCYRQALRLKPDCGETHKNLALIQLSQGDFEHGWAEYEWRWQCKSAISRRSFREPPWDGSPLAGRTILLHVEQGLGDTLQFIRYARLVKERGGTVVVECQPALVGILSMCRGIDRLIAWGSPLPAFDVYTPLLSLPRLFQTTLATVPAEVPYLRADASLVKPWRERLKSLDGFRIGIAWQGSHKYRGDQRRSMPLERFAPLAGVPGVHLISLQKGPGTEQLEQLADRFPVTDVGSQLDEATGAFMDTAAVMKNLDLVVTSDTSIAHLAGALGVPVWLALSAVPDWRWLLDRDDSPWYPSMRLFRQTRLGDWGGVFERLSTVLRQRLAESHNSRGVALAQKGKPAEGEACFRQAVRVKPDFAQGHGNLGNALAELGRPEEALAAYAEAVRLDPDFAQGHSNLGNLLVELGRFEEAVAHCHQAARLQPDSAGTHNNLGNALRGQGRLEAAVASYQEALRLRPDYVEARSNLGVALAEQGKLDEAVATLQQAIRVRPDYVDAHHNLGQTLLKLGKSAAAVASFREVVRLKPDRGQAHGDLGLALMAQGELDEALASCRQAVALAPGHAAVHNSLGLALVEHGRLDEAMASFQQALRHKPDYPDAYLNLGIVLDKQGKLEAAAASYRQAINLNPDFAAAHVNLGNLFKDQGRLDDAIAAYRRALQIKPDAAQVHSNLAFVLHYHPGFDAAAIFEECRRWNGRHAEPLKEFIRPHANHPDPQRRLRVGYVSPDFREHVVSYFALPLLSNHDHQHFEIFCYANVARPDALTQRLHGHADVWRSTTGLSDQQVADLVRSDQIDILVDLTMHTAKNRLLVFARKPAPVQVSWLAYPGTTGLPAIDYRLTDPYLDPPGLFDAFYSEESVRLPDTFWCYDPLTDQPAVNALPALHNGYITLGCLNNFCKVNDGCLVLWAKVLQAVPQARLLLSAAGDQLRDHVLARLHQEDVAGARVGFADKQPRLEYLKLYHRIDLCLDPFPCNGGTTTLDAFWMGVPTITRVGKTVVGRAGWSLLSNLGLRELAAKSPEQYVALAAQLAGDLPRLRELRASLRQRMQRSPLMDGNRFARHVEQAYRHMWHRWCHETAVHNPSGPVSV
jgi:predicted O-linked N-acetylglucosamine transferase (SPINDLY family)